MSDELFDQSVWTRSPNGETAGNLKPQSRVPNDDDIAMVNAMGLEAYHDAKQRNGWTSRPSGPLTMSQLTKNYTKLRAPIIHDALRQGEIMNIIAPPKYGKSWLVNDLAISVAAGIDWLGRFKTEPGKVLLLDNELHPETLAHRIPKIADARGLRLEDYADNLLVQSLRGRAMDVDGLHEFLSGLERMTPGFFQGVRLIILDAWYKFFPRDTDENSNGDVTALYAKLDWLGDQQPFAWVTVHHASKGNQAAKSITDVGAGAGAQSRAPDCHMILRQHETDGAVVVEAACRSFKPLDAFVMRWNFPVWNIDGSLDPTQLKQEKRRPKSKAEEEQEWTAELFAATFGPVEPQAQAVIIAKAEKQKLSNRKAVLLFKAALDQGLIHEHPDALDKRVRRYSSTPFVAPEIPEKSPKKANRSKGAA